MPEVLGSADQRALLRRGLAMHRLTRGDARFTYYGRAVGVPALDDAPLAQVFDLVRLQGSTGVMAVPGQQVAALAEQVEAAGFAPAVYDRWTGGAPALDAARRIMAGPGLPDGYRARWLGPDTPADIVASFAATALGAGVLPPALPALTGALLPGVTCLAVTDAGQVASCAAAVAFLDPSHSQGRDECWWGMLATHPDHRGARLSLYLGAMAMAEMHRRHGFSRFMTGVAPGNAGSEIICARAGLERSGLAILGVADPTLLPGGRMTR